MGSTRGNGFGALGQVALGEPIAAIATVPEEGSAEFRSYAIGDGPAADPSREGALDGLDGRIQAAGKDIPATIALLYQLDPNGAAARVLDSSGALLWQAQFTGLGAAYVSECCGLEQPLRLLGQYYDEETGLHYNRHRYYDPWAGGYISQDPIGLDSGVANVYEFGPNTLCFVDPLGLWNKHRKNGQFARKPGPKPKPKPSVHGNSKTSTKPSVLYAQYDESGVFQKWGITQEVANPRARYGSSIPRDWDVIEVARGTRQDMLNLERELTSALPGPRNFESWAGSNPSATLSSAAKNALAAADDLAKRLAAAAGCRS
ncbi:hypothetical protein I5T79_13020 [Stenotrophomonas maltophilia]|nr:hypothetical protein [Stenotrophomonas maltophilia]